MLLAHTQYMMKQNYQRLTEKKKMHICTIEFAQLTLKSNFNLFKNLKEFFQPNSYVSVSQLVFPGTSHVSSTVIPAQTFKQSKRNIINNVCTSFE